MSVQMPRLPHATAPERDGHAPAPDSRRAPPVRTRTMIVVASCTSAVFLTLLAVGAIPRLRAHRELVAAVQQAQNTPPQVYVIRPQPAAAADLSLAATTQAIQDTVVYARTSGYLTKRYVDIGDHVTEDQLLAEIASPEIDQQLRQAQAELQQSEKNLDRGSACHAHRVPRPVGGLNRCDTASSSGGFPQSSPRSRSSV